MFESIFENYLDAFNQIGDILSGNYGTGALIIFLVLMGGWYIGLGIVGPVVLSQRAAQEGKKSVGAAYMLLFVWGGVAAHRFYANKPGSAILWIVTCGFFGFGFIIDLFMIPGMINTYNMNMIRQNNQMIQNMQMQNLQMQNQQMQYNTPAYNQKPIQQAAYTPNNLSAPKLYVINGELSGAILEIPASGLLIGRDPSTAQLIINDLDVSRKHCVVTHNSGNIYITDYSANGTYLLSGERLAHGVPRQIFTGDVFYLVTKNNSFKVGL